MINKSAIKPNTKSVKVSDVVEQWYLIDATNQKIGRLSTVVAEILLGKKTPAAARAKYLNPNAKVIIINAEKLYIPIKKSIQKEYTQYSGFPGGLKITPLHVMMDKHPERVIEHAVKGMLPKNKRGEAIVKNLHVYAGSTHKHEAQQPKIVNLVK